MKFLSRARVFPSLKSVLAAFLAAILLALAFPDFEVWLLAYVALVPLFYAAEWEKNSFLKSFILGWVFGIVFFFAACWWLSFPMIRYASLPAPLAYFLVLIASLTVGIIPAIFWALFSILLKRFGTVGVLAAPFLWTATEFLRFYATGNNWNAIGYSQAFVGAKAIGQASLGGIYLVGFNLVCANVGAYLLTKWLIAKIGQHESGFSKRDLEIKAPRYFAAVLSLWLLWNLFFAFSQSNQEFTPKPFDAKSDSLFVVAIQPNVPMSGLKYEDRQRLRERHVQLSEKSLETINEQQSTSGERRAIVVFPESPMNFEYARDREFQGFLKTFAAKNNVSVLFNAAEPSVNGGFYNSAVLVDERGGLIAQYDKIHLLPFGEFVPLPAPVAEFVPPVVGNFEFGSSYDLLPLGGEVQAGVMICFESHFPTLSREFAAKGADAIIEMTNDGYLGETPVLRQHLANAVFRAVETNRPVLRVTNVGITAFINERGEVLDVTESYREDARIWTISKSDGRQSFYVKYGDWFAWLCTIISLILIAGSLLKKRRK